MHCGGDSATVENAATHVCWQVSKDIYKCSGTVHEPSTKWCFSGLPLTGKAFDPLQSQCSPVKGAASMFALKAHGCSGSKSWRSMPDIITAASSLCTQQAVQHMCRLTLTRVGCVTLCYHTPCLSHLRPLYTLFDVLHSRSPHICHVALSP